jgi:hypothetical protein
LGEVSKYVSLEENARSEKNYQVENLASTEEEEPHENAKTSTSDIENTTTTVGNSTTAVGDDSTTANMENGWQTVTHKKKSTTRSTFPTGNAARRKQTRSLVAFSEINLTNRKR